MGLRDIAFTSLKRRWGRAAYVAVGLLVGVAAVVALASVAAAADLDVQNKIDRYGANILVTPRGNELLLSYGGTSIVTTSHQIVELTAADVEAIHTIPEAAQLAAVAPKLVGEVEVNGQPALLVGVDLEDELRMKSWWQIGGRAPQQPREVLLGHRAAERLGTGTGNTLSINGETHSVVGVLRETGSSEDGLIFAARTEVERILGRPGAVTFIEISALCHACPIEMIVHQIGERLPNAEVTALAQSVEGRRQVVDHFAATTAAVSVVAIAIGVLVVLAATMGSVAERTREIGILRAVGFRQTHVAGIFLLEAATIGAAGGVIGWLVGLGAARLLAPTVAGLEIAPPVDPTLGMIAVGGAILVGLAGSAYPAIKAAALDPVEALRSL